MILAGIGVLMLAFAALAAVMMIDARLNLRALERELDAICKEDCLTAGQRTSALA